MARFKSYVVDVLGWPRQIPCCGYLTKTPASVSAVFKKLAQHPPHTLFALGIGSLTILNIF